MRGERPIALAAAYLGYREANDPTPLTDWMWVNSPGLMEEMPFILTIPEDRILDVIRASDSECHEQLYMAKRRP